MNTPDQSAFGETAVPPVETPVEELPQPAVPVAKTGILAKVDAALEVFGNEVHSAETFLLALAHRGLVVHEITADADEVRKAADTADAAAKNLPGIGPDVDAVDKAVDKADDDVDQADAAVSKL
jgi:hypothetical protein